MRRSIVVGFVAKTAAGGWAARSPADEAHKGTVDKGYVGTSVSPGFRRLCGGPPHHPSTCQPGVKALCAAFPTSARQSPSLAGRPPAHPNLQARRYLEPIMPCNKHIVPTPAGFRPTEALAPDDRPRISQREKAYRVFFMFLKNRSGRGPAIGSGLVLPTSAAPEGAVPRAPGDTLCRSPLARVSTETHNKGLVVVPPMRVGRPLQDRPRRMTTLGSAAAQGLNAKTFQKGPTADESRNSAWHAMPAAPATLLEGGVIFG